MLGFKIIRKKKWEYYEGMRIDYIRLCNEEVERKQKDIDNIPEIPKKFQCSECQKFYWNI